MNLHISKIFRTFVVAKKLALWQLRLLNWFAPRRDGSERTFHEGEPLVEVIGTIHRGGNRGSKPVILNMFYFSTPGAEITIQHLEVHSAHGME